MEGVGRKKSTVSCLCCLEMTVQIGELQPMQARVQGSVLVPDLGGAFTRLCFSSGRPTPSSHPHHPCRSLAQRVAAQHTYTRSSRHPSTLAFEGITPTMSRDPYHDFASDLKSSLSSARSLSQSYRQLLSSQASASSSSSGHATSSSEVDSAYDRLSDAIEGLRQDVEDVKQSVLVVERSGPERFGVTPEELNKRKGFVAECESEINVSHTPA